MASEISSRTLPACSAGELEEFVKTLLASVSTLVMVINKQGRVLYANDAFRERLQLGPCTLSGALPGELIRCMNALVEPGCGRGPECLSCPMRNALVAALADSTETLGMAGRRLIKTSGGTVPFDFSMSVFPLTLQGQRTALALVDDWSELLKTVDERDLYMQEVVRERNLTAVGAISSGIAHDLNNVLGSVLGNAELLGFNESLCGDDRESVEEILKACSKARDLVRRILSLGKLGAEGRKAVDPRTEVDGAVRMLMATPRPGVKLKWSMGDHLGHLLAEDGQLFRVVLNLCLNSLQALEGREGAVAVTLEREESDGKDQAAYLNLVVADDGEGIASEILPHIFEPFFTTRQFSGNAGLGLAVVRETARAMGGKVEVVSTPGEGARFTVRLPLLQEVPSLRPQESAEGFTKKGARVLVVEDEAQLLRLMVRMLEKLGCEGDGAMSRGEAEDFLSKGQGGYELVITDELLPDGRGSELCKLIKNRFPSMPVILCSGNPELMDENRARDCGASAFLAKPLDLSVLGRELGRVLGR